jgi:hypothetical protein
MLGDTAQLCLKVLSSDRSSLKMEARRFLEKSARPPSCESPLKIPRHLVQLLAIRILIAKSKHHLFYNIHLLATVQRTNLEAAAMVQ